MKPSILRLLTMFVAVSMAVAPFTARPAAAATTLSVTPITWDIVGLDSNTPASGPNRFPVGARVCSTGSTDASNVTASFTWDSANPNIYLRPGSLDSINLGSIPAGTCRDAYFEAEVNTAAGAYDFARQYHITATDSPSGVSATTPRPRQLYVEHLISQNRNGLITIKLDGAPIPAGGAMTLAVGKTYDISLEAFTATQGYNELESFITLPNTVFQVLSVTSTYSANTAAPRVTSPSDKLWADACLWDSDPNSPNYRSCIGGDDKTGGNPVVTTYHVRVISGAGSHLTLSSLLYDYSGSSFHYNADMSTSVRFADIVAPTSVTISKSFSPKSIAPTDPATLTFRIGNPTGQAFGGINFTDPLPAGMTVANPSGVVYSGCGAGAFTNSPLAGATSLAFANGSVAANGTCTISLTVRVASAGTYVNTTGHLYVETGTDTGNTATDTLMAASAAACVPGQTLASWTIPLGTTANPPDLAGGLPTTKGAGVATATAVAAVPANSSIIATSGHGDGTSWSTFGYKNAGQAVTFTLDTRKYSTVQMSYWVSSPGVSSGGQSTGPTSLTVGYSTGGAFTTAQTIANPVAAFTQHTVDFTGLTNTNGTTAFKISGAGANNDNSGANVDIDDITFTGCLAAAAAPTLTKAFAPDPIVKGSSSTLTFTLANTAVGNEALSGVTFTDVLPAGLSVASGSATGCGGTVATTASTRTIALTGGTLAAGGSCSFSVPVTGSIEGAWTNVTGFVSTAQSGTTASYATAGITVNAPPVLTKAFDSTGIRTGDTTWLRFHATNPNSATTLTGVGFSDTLPLGLELTATAPTSTCGGTLSVGAPGSRAISISGVSLAPGASCDIAVEVKGVTAGALHNTTSPISSTQGGAGAAATADILVIDPVARVDLNKQVSTDGSTWRKHLGVSVGAGIYYRFTAYNSGDTTLTGLTVYDPDALTCTWTGDGVPLVPGATAYCQVGPIAALSGSHANTATVAATHAGGSASSAPSTATYATTALALDKSAGEARFTAAGNVLHYGYVVTNTGYYPLLGPVTVGDDKATVTCPAVSTQGDGDGYLDPADHTAPGSAAESLTCTASYDATAGDVTAKGITNTATASAGGVTSPADTVTVGLARLALAKTAAETRFTAGGTIHYSYLVTNTGSVGLAGPVTVADDKASVTCPAVTTTGDLDGTFDPDESLACSATYSVTAGDVTAKGVTNTATASAEGVTSPQDSVTLGLAALAVDKTATETRFAAAGDVLHYSYIVTNTGSTGLAGPVTVTDDKSTDEACPPVTTTGNADGVLDAGEALTCSASYTVLAGDVTAKGVTNVATASAGGITSPSDSVTVGLAALAVDKTSTTTSITRAGQAVPYVFAVTNTGSVALSGVTLVDATCDASPVRTGGDTNSDNLLQVTETWAYACTRTVTQAEMDAGGSLSNTATADSVESAAASDTLEIAVVQDPVIDVAKASTTTSIDHAGQVVPYTFTVTNPGTVTLTGITVVDELCDATPVLASGDANEDGKLQPAETWHYGCGHTVTQAELDAGGTLHNVVTADASASDPATDALDILVDQNPAIHLVKASTTSSVDHAGQVVPYTLTVTNTGNTTLTGVTVADPGCTSTVSGPSGDTDEDGRLELAETWVYTCSHTVTQAEMDAGGMLTNTATAGSAESDPASDRLDIPVDQQPVIDLAKTSTTTSITGAGQVVEYDLAVTNAGNVTLTGITVTDTLCDAAPGLESGDTNGDGKLQAAETWAYTCSRTVTQAEMDAGGMLSNTATAGSAESDPASDEASIPIAQDPALAISKTAEPAEIGNTGSIAYEITVHNTGNVTLTGVALDDEITAGLATLDTPALTGPAGDTDEDGLLDVGETWTWTASYQVTQADLDRGDPILNTATVRTAETAPEEATARTDIIAGPAMNVTKDADVASVTAAGQVVHYTIRVTNTGQVNVTGVSVSDPRCDADTLAGPTGDDGNDRVVAPTETWTYTCSRTVTQADIDAGGVLSNTVTAVSDQTGPDEDTLDLAVVQDPALTIHKTADASSIDRPTAIGYDVEIANTGNVTLTGVTLADVVKAGSAVLGTPSLTLDTGDANFDGLLGVGETWHLSGRYDVTQADIDRGTTIVNTATVTTTRTDPQDATASTAVDQSPAIHLVKASTTSSVDHAGQVVPYTLTVTNTGNTTLTGVTVADPGCTSTVSGPSGDTNEDGRLELAETWVYTCSHTVTQAEMDAGGMLTNTATAGSAESDPASDRLDIEIAGSGAISVAKSSTTTSITAAGQVVPYVFTVTNTGPVTLTHVTVSDPQCTTAITGPAGDTNEDAKLQATETWRYTCSHTVTQDEMDGGTTLSNTATVDAAESAPASDTKDITIAATPAIHVAKSSTTTSVDHAGQVVPYVFTVTNAGNVTLTGITVSDAKCTTAVTGRSGDTNGDGKLQVAETWAYACSHTVTQAEMDAPSHQLSNTVTADSSESAPSTAGLDIAIGRAPAIHLAKASTTASIDHAGQVVPYAFTVTNTGNVTLSGVTLADPGCDAGPVFSGTDTNHDGRLDLDETWSYTCSRAITQSDLDGGGNVDTTATADSIESAPAEATHPIPVVQAPSLSLVKAIVTGTYFVKVGDVITYRYVVTNTGNVTIAGPITVEDDKTPVSCPVVASLAPAATVTCTSVYHVTKADLDAGRVTNTARASGQLGEITVESSVVAVSAGRVVPPSAPPSTSLDRAARAVPGGWGSIALIALLGVGLLTFAVAGRRTRRRTPRR